MSAVPLERRVVTLVATGARLRESLEEVMLRLRLVVVSLVPAPRLSVSVSVSVSVSASASVSAGVSVSVSLGSASGRCLAHACSTLYWSGNTAAPVFGRYMAHVRQSSIMFAKYGTQKTVKARIWPRLSCRSP